MGGYVTRDIDFQLDGWLINRLRNNVNGTMPLDGVPL